MSEPPKSAASGSPENRDSEGARDAPMLRAVVDAMTDAVFVKDRDGRYLMINAAGARFLGKDVAEVIGQDDWSLFAPEAAAAIVESDRAIMATQVTETHAEKATAAGITRTYLITNGPYRDATGEVIGIVGIAREVTESLALARERDNLLARLRLHLERLPLACISFDARHRVLEWNPAAARIFGYTRQEALGRGLLELIEPAPREQVEAMLRLLEAGSMDAHGTNQNRTKDGREITCDWFNTPILDAGGKFAGSVSLAQDVTERARLYDELTTSRNQLRVLSRQLFEAQEVERRQVARELHDEIGQVLTVVLISLDQVKPLVDAAVVPQVDESRAIVQRAVHQVRDLSLDLRPPMLDDLGLVAALRWFLDRQRDRHGCEMVFSAASNDAPLPTEIANAGFRVAQEAVTNALRHARAERVWVDVEQSEGHVQVTVRDDGIGFDPGEVRRRATAGASFGVLGMQERVALLGGRFEIEASPGRGAQIRAHLPLPGAPTVRRGKGAVPGAPTSGRSN